MPEDLETRVTRLENLMGVLAEKQAQLDDVLTLLTEAQIKTEERFLEVAERFKATDARFQATDARLQEMAERTDARFREMAERSQAIDARSEKLVSAIGELIRSNQRKAG